MKRTIPIVLAVLLVLTFTPFSTAYAMYTTPNTDNSGYHASSGNPFAWGQCTWFAWGRAYEHCGAAIAFSQSSGRNANRWLDMVNNQIIVRDPNQPREHAIAVWSGGDFGHVAFVEEVSGSTITFTEANWPLGSSWSKKTLSLSNFIHRGSYTLLGYIYIGGSSGGGGGNISAPSLYGPGNNQSFSINSNVSFSWSNVGSRYHFLSTNPSGVTNDIYTYTTSCAFSPSVAGTWRWKVRYESDTSTSGPWSEERSFTITDSSHPSQPNETYNVQYYNDTGCGTIGGAVSSEGGLTSVSKDWGTGNSPGGCTTNQFSAVFTGNISFGSGWYMFNYTVDDSIKLWLSKDSFSDCICDNNGQKDSPQSGHRYYNIQSAGTYTVRVEYIKCHPGTGVVQVSWTPVQPPMLNVYFDSQGGGYVPTQTVLCDSKVAKPADPVRAGYTFDGWYRDSNCSTPFNFSSDTIGGDTTLYAGWTIENYTVYFNSQGGSSVGTQTVNYGAQLSQPANPTRSGYKFGGWFQEEQCWNQWNFSSDAVMGDMTLYAKWTSTVVPSAPAGLKAYPVSYNSIKLTWNAVSGATAYEIWRMADGEGTYTGVRTTTSTSFTNTGLATGTRYYYRVRAYILTDSTKVYGHWSDIVYIRPVPAAPASAKAAQVTYNSIKVTWSAVAGASKYALYRATSKTGTYSLVAVTTALSYTNTSVNTGTVYYYKVRAYRIMGSTNVYGNYSPIVSAKTVLGVPPLAKAARASSTSIKVSWSALAGTTKYEVWRYSAATETYAFLASTTSLSYTNTGLITGRTYYYKVIAYRLVGGTKVYGGFSAVVYAKP